MKYLLDTDTLIGFIQDRAETRVRIAAMTEAGDLLALCPVTVAELYSGLNEKNLRLFSDWLRSLPYWDISPEAAKQAGIYRKSASGAGRTLHVSDCLLAACAREQQATVLTSNIKDYPMRDVRVLSLWDKAA
jgi:predicted nucleic acid-binding protein